MAVRAVDVPGRVGWQAVALVANQGKTAEKLASCSKLPEGSRSSVAAAAKQIKDMLQMVDDAGGFDSAPAETVDQMRNACKSQNTRIVDEMQKTFPECLK